MPRKGENIFKRKDGRWEARYIHHYENGKAKYRFVYGNSYTEAKQKRSAEMMSGEITQRIISKNNKTVSQISHEWLSDIKVSVKESTYTRYHRIVMKYIIPRFGEEQLLCVDSHRINKYTNELLEKGGVKGVPLSPKTVTDILCVMKSIYKFGNMNGYTIPNLSGIRYPPKNKKAATILTQECRTTLEKKLLSSNDSTSIGVLLTLFTGIRIGELCGLQWGDIDFCDSTLKIKRTVERIADLSSDTDKKTKVIISKPKTEASFREIPLPAFLADYLFKYKKDPQIYLLSDNQKFIEPHCFYTRYKQFLSKHGVGNYTFHALRHTFATECVAHGFDTKSLSEILGHSSVTTTMMLYVHPSIEQKRKQMELLTPICD